MNDKLDLNQKLMTRKETARHLKNQFGLTISPLTLDTYASQGGGPKYIKFGRRAYYEAADIETWVRSRISRKFASTTDEQTRLQEPLS